MLLLAVAYVLYSLSGGSSRVFERSHEREALTHHNAERPPVDRGAVSQAQCDLNKVAALSRHTTGAVRSADRRYSEKSVAMTNNADGKGATMTTLTTRLTQTAGDARRATRLER